MKSVEKNKIKNVSLKLAFLTALCLCVPTAKAGDLGSEFSACTGAGCPPNDVPGFGILDYSTSGENCGVTTAGGPPRIIGSDSSFSVFVGGNFTVSPAGAAEAEGVVGIAGNFINSKISGAYNIGVAGLGSCVTAPDGETHITVGGISSTTGSSNAIIGALGISGDAELADTPTAANYTFCASGCDELPLSDPSFAASVAAKFVEFQTTSQCLVDFDVNVDASDQYRTASYVNSFGNASMDCPGTAKVGGKCPAGTYIATIDGSQLDVGFVSNLDTLTNFTDDGNTTLIVNVTGTGTISVRTQPAGAAFNPAFARSMLWNFQNASQVNFEGQSQFNGSVLIPNGGSEVRASGMNGRFIVGGDVLHDQVGSEFHNFDFIGDIPDDCAVPPAGGSITIIKSATPSDAQDFQFSATGASPSSFSLDDDADGTLSNTQVFNGLADGSYTFTEDLIAGWELSNISCIGATASSVAFGGDSFDAGDRTVEVDLSGAENIVCTFSNSLNVGPAALCPTPIGNILLDNFNTANTCGVFSGTAGGVNPIPPNERYTFGLIDTTSALANAGAGRTNVTASVNMFHHPQWLVTDIGNLYGTTIDLATGDMFATASSNYGSRFVSNIAVLQYGSIGGGENATGAGAVYKMDAVTGAPSLFATLPQSAVTVTHDSCEDWAFTGNPGPTNVRNNVGVGLGNIVWDRIHNQLFVSNFEDGRIYRLDMAGNILDAYDPDETDNGSAGFANGFVPYGLALSNDGQKLFYGGTGREIFSIDLDGAGFMGTATPSGNGYDHFENATETLHTTLPTDASIPILDVWVTDLEFTPDDKLLVGNRTICNDNFASSYNHDAHPYELEANGAGLFNTNLTQVRVSYDSNGSGLAGGNDTYGGVAYFENLLTGELEYGFSSADTITERGPHGIVILNSSSVSTSTAPISPMAAIAYSDQTNSEGGFNSALDVKGVGGDLQIYNDRVCFDLGDAPDTYSTLVNSSGPLHANRTDGFFIGNLVDTEFDGVPSVGADGDDLQDQAGTAVAQGDAADDEDGLVTPGSFALGENIAFQIPVNNPTTDTATLYGWFDLNDDGDFGDAGEFTQVSVPAGTTSATPLALDFASSISVTSETYLRLRLTTDTLTATDFTGYASDGEIEDHLVQIQGVSLGSTLWLDENQDGLQTNGEQPIVGASVLLLNADGTSFDSDPIAPGIQALSVVTDANGNYNFNDLPEGDYRVKVDVGAASVGTSVTPLDLLPTPSQVADPDAIGPGQDNNLDSNIDLDVPGTSVGANAGDLIDDAMFTSGVITLLAGDEPIDEPNTLAGGDDQPGQDVGDPDVNGNMTLDMGFIVVNDLGDAPDTYGTTIAAGGPVHPINSNLVLGSVVDSEVDGAPSVLANGDDQLGVDDEDSINIAAQTPLTVADGNGDQTSSYALNNISVINTAGITAFVVGYIDFNGDGDFNDAGERSATAVANATGSVNLTFPAIANINAGDTYLRLRLSSDESAILSPGGTAVDGEIEDYPVSIAPVVGVQKVLVPASVTDTFDLAAGSETATAVGNGGATQYVTFGSPAITISETPSAANTSTYVTESQCTDANGAVVYAGAVGDLSLSSDEITVNGSSAAENIITCTFTNTNVTTVAVIKTATPADSTDFAFTSDVLLEDLVSGSGSIPNGAFTLDGELIDSDSDNFINQISTMGNLPTGDVTFTETVPSGWLLRSVSCTDLANGATDPLVVDGSITSNGTQGSVTVNVAVGDTISCTFDNVETVSLGSVIWDDSALGAGNIAVDGQQQLNEPGINGASVTLIDNSTGVAAINPATGIAFPTVTTSTIAGVSGSYNFNGMLPGDYRISVQLPAANAAYIPTLVQETNANGDVNNDSNMESFTDATPASLPFGSDTSYLSAVISLSTGAEPTAEEIPGGGTDDQPNQAGLDDLNGNMSLDMGFIQVVSLGSTVWFDDDVDGIQDLTEAGIEGATVTLLNSDGSDYDSNPNLAGIQTLTDITDANGQYNFNDLLPGDYRVQVDVSTATSPTSALIATPVQVADPDDAGDNNTDSNIDDSAPGHNPSADIYQSGIVTLSVGGEPENETDPIDNGGVLTADQPGQGLLASAQPDSNGNMTVDMGFYTPMSLGSTIWFDSDSDGTQDSGEPPVEGATVTLYLADGITEYDSDLGTPGTQALTVATDPDGQYNFNGLPEGDYRIQVDLSSASSIDGTSLIPSPEQVADPDLAGDDNTDSNVDSTAPGQNAAGSIYQSGIVTLVIGDEETGESDPIGTPGPDQPNQGDIADANGNMTVDMGFIAPVSLGSTIWEDLNGNGMQDASELPIVGATITLLDSAGVPIPGVASIPTNGNGEYSFNDLPPGEYRVQVDLSSVAGGGDLFPSPVQVASPENDNISDSNIDIAADPNASDQIHVSGVVILTAGGEPENEQDLIDVSAPAAPLADQPNQGLTAANQPDNSGNMTVDMGFVRPVSLGSTLWVDSNVNGNQDDLEDPIVGATVTLVDPVTGSPIAGVTSVVTDATGQYNFNGLPPGDYRVQVDISSAVGASPGLAPTLVQNTAPNDNNNDDSNIDSALDVNPADQVYFSAAITLTAGDEPELEVDLIDGVDGNGAVPDQPQQDGDDPDSSGNMTLDMGFFEAVSLGSTLWFDANANGFQDPQEPAIEGVEVTLFLADGITPYDRDPSTGAVDFFTVTTNVNGEYVFNGLPEGDYRVQANLITATNFTGAALAPTPNQVPDPDDPGPGLDNNDDSNIDSLAPGTNATAGIFQSGVVTLAIGLEPTSETDAIGAGSADQPQQGTAQPDANGNMTVDMGFIAPVSVGSTIWQDLNGDGTQDAGELPIVNARVTLLNGDGSEFDSNPLTPAIDALFVFTDGDGQYNFNGLPTGDYRIQVDLSTVTDGADFFPTPVQVPDPDTLGAGLDNNTDSNIDLAFDPNQNDQIHISGVVQLTVGGEPLDETDPIGTPGVDQPNQGLAANDDPDDSGNMTVDMGFVKPVSLGSTLWRDSNGDGQQSDTELPVVGAEVILLNADGTVFDNDPYTLGDQTLTIPTDSEGQYNFNGLPPGDYRIQADLSSAVGGNLLVPSLLQTPDPDDAGDNNDDSNVDAAFDPDQNDLVHFSGVVTLSAGDEPENEADLIDGIDGNAAVADQPNQDLDDPDNSGNMTVDMGFYEPVSLGSTIWFDANTDGNQGSGEPPIIGAVVTLLNAAGGVYDSDPVTPGVQNLSVATDSDGQYNFNGLPEGEYRVEVNLNPATNFTGGGLRPTLIQVPDPDAAGPGLDNNEDSNVEAQTGLGIFRTGIVELTVGGEPELEVDSIGAGGADQPNQTGSQPDANGNMTVDMGFFAPASLGSTVWEDTNGNGNQDSGEPAIVGATITLLNPDGSDFDSNPNLAGVQPLEVATDIDGQYNFNELPAGDYRIKVDLSTVIAGGDLFPTPTQVADPDAVGPGQDNNTDSNIDVPFDTNTNDQVHTTGIVTLLPGTEPLNEEDPIGTPGQDQPNQALALIDDPDDAGNMTVDMGFVRPVSLGSTIWQDGNTNGMQDDNEPPIVGATVTLLDSTGNPIVGVTPVQTDGQGQYNFNGLPPGDYRIQVDLSTVAGGETLIPSPVQVPDPDPAGVDNNNDSNVDIVFDPNPLDQIHTSGVVTLAAGTEDENEVDLIDGVNGNVAVADQPNQGAGDPDNSGNMSVDMGFYAPSSIGSFIWEDINGDGQQDANEPPIAGARVTLLVETAPNVFAAAVDITNTTIPTLTVGPDGLYLFDNLPLGNYKIQVQPPAGVVPSEVQTDANNDDGTSDSNIAAETAPGSGIFESGEFELVYASEPVEGVDANRGDAQDGVAGGIRDLVGNMSIDFGFVPPAAIGNYVWLDLDMDGVQDANEDGIAGVEVTLTPPPGVDAGAGIDVAITVITGPNGEYLFPDLPPFTDANTTIGYVVEVDPNSLPDGLVQTFDEGLGGVVGILDDTSDPIQLSPNEEHLTADFGYAPPIGSIGDTVWVDANDDGIQDLSEPGIVGVTVTLTPAPDVDPDGPGPAGPGDSITTVTDPNGKYLFTDLPLGETYVIDVDISTSSTPGYVSSSSNLGDPDVRDGNSTTADDQTTVVLTTELPVNLDADFGYLPPDDQNNSVGDTIWIDADSNGQGPAGAVGGGDTGELPISGVTVSLVDNDTQEVIASDITDVNGQYLFTGIPDGSYTVKVTDQNNVLAGLTQTFDNDGTGTPNESIVELDPIGAITTPVQNLDQDFGYVNENSAGEVGSIGDTVFFDENDSGLPDQGEGLEGVTLLLFGPGPDGNISTTADNVLLDTQVTDENGNYLFTGLDVSDTGANPGTDYQVQVDVDSLPNGSDGWVNSVDPDTVSDANNPGDDIGVATLSAAIPSDLGQDFGYIGEDGNSLEGTVFSDTDGDGEQNEPGRFGGVSIEVRDENGNVIRKIFTDPNGDYSVSNLPDGRFTVVVTDEANVLAPFEHTDSPNGTVDTGDMTSKDDTGYVVDLDSAGVINEPVNDATGDFGYRPSITNPISLGSFYAVAEEGGVRFEWMTQTEVANLGFHIYARFEGNWVQLNSKLIPSYGDSVAIQTYSLTVETEATMFALSDIDLTGKETLHGPFRLGEVQGVIGERRSIDWNAEKAERKAKRGARKAARKANQQRRELQRKQRRAEKSEETSMLLSPSESLQAAPFASLRVVSSRSSLDSSSASLRDSSSASSLAASSPSLRVAPSPSLRAEGEANSITNSQTTSRPSWYIKPLAAVISALVPVANAAQSDGAPGEDIVNLATQVAGLHAVLHTELLAAEIDLDGVPVADIALMNGGVPVPITVIGSEANAAVFGEGASVRFAAEAIDTLYTDTNVYTLRLDLDDAMRLPVITPTMPNGGFANAYLAKATFAPQAKYSFVSPNKSDPWYAKRIVAVGEAERDTMNVQLDHLAVGGNTGSTIAKLSVDVWGSTDLPGPGDDHHVKVSVNGTPVVDGRFDGLAAKRFDSPVENLKDGSNQVTLELPMDTGQAFDAVHVNEVTIRYPRQFVAQNNRLNFDSSLRKFRLKGFAASDLANGAGDLIVLQQTAGGAALVGNAQVGCRGSCEVTFASVGGAASYMVSTTSALHRPSLNPLPLAQDLNAGPAAYLIISHPDFIGNANLQSLKNDLADEFGSADIVDVEAIYADLGHHVFDPIAIQTYIQQAVSLRGTQMVLLVGGDVYDYRQFENEDAESFIPSLYAATGNNITFAPVDAKYVDLDNDNVPDLPIGRLPVRTDAQLDALLGKRQAYIDRDYAGTALLVADEYDQAQQYDFSDDAEEIRADYLSSWNTSQVYVDEITANGGSVGQARAELTSQINQGQTLTAFFGHSSTSQWAFNGLFTGPDAANLQNQGKPTVVTQWGCWNAYYVSPNEDSMGHRFMMEGEQGAVAVMGASTLTSADAERKLARKVFERLANGERLGQAITNAKQDYAQDNPNDLDVLLGWTLLGLPELIVN